MPAKSILLLEDDDNLAVLIQDVFERHGYVVVRGKNGAEGIRLLKQVTPDLILLDLQMPEMNGYQVLESLRKEGNRVPVIVISNSGQPVELQRLAEFGVVDYLIKAEFDPTELLGLVDQFFTQGRVEGRNSTAENVEAAEPHALPEGSEAVWPGKERRAVREPQKPKVLVVEDDVFLADIIMQKLRQYPYELALARTGEEAIQCYDSQHPDLILLDLLLPGISGIEVLRHIRSVRNDATTRVVVVSNFSEEGHREEVEQLGAQRYMVKANVSPGEIAKVVEEELRAAGKVA